MVQTKDRVSKIVLLWTMVGFRWWCRGCRSGSTRTRFRRAPLSDYWRCWRSSPRRRTCCPPCPPSPTSRPSTSGWSPVCSSSALPSSSSQLLTWWTKYVLVIAQNSKLKAASPTFFTCFCKRKPNLHGCLEIFGQANQFKFSSWHQHKGLVLQFILVLLCQAAIAAEIIRLRAQNHFPS